MLSTNRLKAALAARQPVFGLINSIAAPLLVEMTGYAGYDFMILDLEHLGMNPETLEHAIRAVECAGVEAIAEIVVVPGIDMVLEGAIDLVQSYGAPGDAQHPQVQVAVARISEACLAQGVPLCAVPRVPGQYAHWREQRVLAFLLGDDRATAFRALRQGLAACRDMPLAEALSRVRAAGAPCPATAAGRPAGPAD